MAGRPGRGDAGPSALMPATTASTIRFTCDARRSVPQGDEDEEDEHNQHDDAPRRELPDLAPHALDLSAAGPDAQPGLIGARGVPDQESGGDREYEGQQNRPIWGDRKGCVYLTAQWRSVSTGMQG